MNKLNYKLLSISIALQPLVNSITGLSIKSDIPSIAGPVFYSSIIVYLLILLVAKLNIASVLTLTATSLTFLAHYINNNSEITDAPNYLKLILPVIIFLYIKNTKINKIQFENIKQSIKYSVLIYALLVIASFLFNYQIQEGKGYYGLIYAGNDLIALFILFAAMAYWNKFNFTKSLLVVLVAHTLTLSKTILVYPFVLAAGQFRKSLVRSLLATTLALGISYLFLKEYLFKYILNFIPNLNSIFDLLNHDIDNLAKIVSFGRTSYLEDGIKFISSDSFNWIFGVGSVGAEKALFGKVGIEMDFFDALLMYGSIGVIYLVIFYYSLPLLCKNINLLSKIIFGFAIIYSFFGGHFYNNPMVGFYYGLFIGLAYNRHLSSFIAKKHKINVDSNAPVTPEK